MEGKEQSSGALEGLIERLHSFLKRYDSVAVAFSGGVDSTVLLHNCCRLFASSKVLALHASSCLQSARAAATTREVMAAHFAASCQYSEVRCEPLQWSDFVQNDIERCYYCKKRTYSLLLAEVKKRRVEVLLDGSNISDLLQYRPGMKAAKELGIVSPFIVTNISKHDIREYSRRHDLINHDLPSNSCLATRIPAGDTITSERMIVIEKMEEFLISLGFHAVRVRPFQGFVHIEVLKKDLQRIFEPLQRKMVIDYFQDLGMGQVFIGIAGR